MTKSIFNPIRTIAATGALAAVALFAAQPAIADDHADDQAVEMTKGEKELAELLEGRVAGEPGLHSGREDEGDGERRDWR